MKIAIAILVFIAIMHVACYGEVTANDWAARGDQLSLSGSYDTAVSAYDRALELDQNNSTILVSKGVALANLGKYAMPLLALIRPFAKFSNANAWYYKGTVLSVNLGEYNEGLTCFSINL